MSLQGVSNKGIRILLHKFVKAMKHFCISLSGLNFDSNLIQCFNFVCSDFFRVWAIVLMDLGEKVYPVKSFTHFIGPNLPTIRDCYRFPIQLCSFQSTFLFLKIP